MGTFKTLTKTTAAVLVHSTGAIKGGLDAMAETIEATDAGYLYDRQNNTLNDSFTKGKAVGYDGVSVAINYTSDMVGSATDAVLDAFSSDDKKPVVKKPMGYGSFGK